MLCAPRRSEGGQSERASSPDKRFLAKVALRKLEDHHHVGQIITIDEKMNESCQNNTSSSSFS